MPGQTDYLNPHSTSVSAPGMCSLYSLAFLGTHPLYNPLQVSPATRLSDAVALQAWCEPWQIVACLRDGKMRAQAEHAEMSVSWKHWKKYPEDCRSLQIK